MFYNFIDNDIFDDRDLSFIVLFLGIYFNVVYNLKNIYSIFKTIRIKIKVGN